MREGQVKYLRYLLVEGKDLVRRVAEELVESRQGRWIKRKAQELKDLRELTLLKGSIQNETKESISSIMKTRDTQAWREALNDKTSVTLYKEHRKETGGQDEVYTNDIASDILLKCTTNPKIK